MVRRSFVECKCPNCGYEFTWGSACPLWCPKCGKAMYKKEMQGGKK